MSVEWPLVLFSLLAGCGGCTFAYLALSDLLTSNKKGQFQIALVALIVAVVGGFCSVAHLASPQNVMAAVWNIGSFSGISIELILIGITCVLMVVYMVLLKRGAAESALKAVATVGGVFGLLLAFFTGHGYVIESQATWNTELLPFAYLGTSLALGAFLYAVCAVVCKVDEADLRKMAIPVGVGAVLGAVSILGYVLAVGFEAAATEPVLLWGGLIACGIVITAICGVVVMARKQNMDSLAVPCVGLAATAVGAVSLRAFMWVVGSGFLGLFEVAMNSRVIGL